MYYINWIPDSQEDTNGVISLDFQSEAAFRLCVNNERVSLLHITLREMALIFYVTYFWLQSICGMSDKCMANHSTTM